jgi:hypothetical protein
LRPASGGRVFRATSPLAFKLSKIVHRVVNTG